MIFIMGWLKHFEDAFTTLRCMVIEVTNREIDTLLFGEKIIKRV